MFHASSRKFVSLAIDRVIFEKNCEFIKWAKKKKLLTIGFEFFGFRR